jgi:FkbM family methyltransferase
MTLALDSLRDVFHPRVGYFLHRAGILRWRVFRPASGRNHFVDRCWAYARSYYNRHESLEATLALPEVGATIYCDIRDWLVRPYVDGDSDIYEWPFIRHAMALCRPGDVVLDVGANQGLWSVALGSATGRGGHVVAIDANPVLARRLRRTAALNRDRFGMTVVESAIGDGSAASMRFFLPTASNSGTGSTVLHDYAVKHGFLDEKRGIEVPCVSLDALSERLALDRVDIVKIDVEFGEDALVRGALRTFETHRPRVVVCETGARSAAFDTFIGLGYRASVIDGDTEKGVAPDYWGTIFFKRAEGAA